MWSITACPRKWIHSPITPSRLSDLSQNVVQALICQNFRGGETHDNTWNVKDDGRGRIGHCHQGGWRCEKMFFFSYVTCIVLLSKTSHNLPRQPASNLLATSSTLQMTYMPTEIVINHNLNINNYIHEGFYLMSEWMILGILLQFNT